MVEKPPPGSPTLLSLLSKRQVGCSFSISSAISQPQMGFSLHLHVIEQRECNYAICDTSECIGMSNQVMRFSNSRQLCLEAFVVVAIASLLVSASANASSLWPGFTLGGFVGDRAISTSLDITPRQDAAAKKREDRILAVIGLSSRRLEMHRLFEDPLDDANGDASALKFDRMNEMIMHRGWNMSRRSSTDGTEVSAVPEPGSALMLGLGMIVLTVRAKRARARPLRKLRFCRR